MYTLSNKNQEAFNFLTLEPAVTSRTVIIIPEEDWTKFGDFFFS